MASEWFYTVKGEKHGPVSSQELRRLAQEGTLSRTDLLWKEGMKDWRPASEAQKLFEGVSTVDASRQKTAGTTPALAPPSADVPSNPKAAVSLGARMKDAARATALKAEQTKLTTVSLPAAYIALGKHLHSNRLLIEQFPDLYHQIDALQAKAAEASQKATEAKGEGFRERAKALAQKGAELAKSKAAEMQQLAVFKRLGEAAAEPSISESIDADRLKDIVAIRERVATISDALSKPAEPSSIDGASEASKAPDRSKPAPWRGRLKWIGGALVAAWLLGFVIKPRNDYTSPGATATLTQRQVDAVTQENHTLNAIKDILKLTDSDKAKLRRMSFSDVLTKAEQDAMKRPIDGEPTFKTLEYEERAGILAEATGEVFNARGLFYKPGYPQYVGMIMFHNATPREQFRYPHQFTRMNPAADHIQEFFAFNRQGQLVEYIRSLRVKDDSGIQVVEMDAATFEQSSAIADNRDSINNNVSVSQASADQDHEVKEAAATQAATGQERVEPKVAVNQKSPFPVRKNWFESEEKYLQRGVELVSSKCRGANVTKLTLSPASEPWKGFRGEVFFDNQTRANVEAHPFRNDFIVVLYGATQWLGYGADFLDSSAKPITADTFCKRAYGKTPEQMQEVFAEEESRHVSAVALWNMASNEAQMQKRYSKPFQVTGEVLEVEKDFSGWHVKLIGHRNGRLADGWIDCLMKDKIGLDKVSGGSTVTVEGKYKSGTTVVELQECRIVK
jgi:hypothetical protein